MKLEDDKLKHLPPGEAFLTRSKEDKIRLIYEDNYIRYPAAETALKRLERLFNKQHQIRPEGMALISEPGMGKTTILKTFMKKHLPQQTEEGTIRPVIYVQTPPVSGEKRLLGAWLKALGYTDYPRNLNTEARELRVFELTKKSESRMILLDEFHNLLSGTAREREATLNQLKNLSNELHLPIVVAGVVRAKSVLEYDLQIKSRFPPFILHKWKDGEEYRDFLKRLELMLPLERPSNLSSNEKARFILESSGGITHDITKAVKNAAVDAIWNNENAITLDRLKDSIDSMYDSLIESSVKKSAMAKYEALSPRERMK